MRVARSCWRSLYLLLLLIAAAVDGRVRRPKVGAAGAVWIHGWSRRIVRALGIICNVNGVLAGRWRSCLLNHFVAGIPLLLSTIRPFVMVAKKEVRDWPLLRWLTAQAGPAYVKRGGGAATYPEVNRAMAEAYRSGLPVVFFPEGTTTDGAYPEGRGDAVSARLVSFGVE